MRYHTPFATTTLPAHYEGSEIEIVHHAPHALRDGWRRCIIDVPQGDIAYAPGSTKRAIVGPTTMVYEITAMSTDGFEFNNAAEFYDKLFESRTAASA